MESAATLKVPQNIEMMPHKDAASHHSRPRGARIKFVGWVDPLPRPLPPESGYQSARVQSTRVQRWTGDATITRKPMRS